MRNGCCGCCDPPASGRCCGGCCRPMLTPALLPGATVHRRAKEGRRDCTFGNEMGTGEESGTMLNRCCCGSPGGLDGEGNAVDLRFVLLPCPEAVTRERRTADPPPVARVSDFPLLALLLSNADEAADSSIAGGGGGGEEGEDRAVDDADAALRAFHRDANNPAAPATVVLCPSPACCLPTASAMLDDALAEEAAELGRDGVTGMLPALRRSRRKAAAGVLAPEERCSWRERRDGQASSLGCRTTIIVSSGGCEVVGGKRALEDAGAEA